MRLWSLHPQYLDPQGLVALWREALLAQAVLAGLTRGYRQHPQLERFSAHRQPLKAMGTYLRYVAQEAKHRGYSFDASKILEPSARARLGVTTGQLAYEASHLQAKLAARSPHWLARLDTPPLPHPMFSLETGALASWERTGGG
jgi:hypothetical protein